MVVGWHTYLPLTPAVFLFVASFCKLLPPNQADLISCSLPAYLTYSAPEIRTPGKQNNYQTKTKRKTKQSKKKKQILIAKAKRKIRTETQRRANGKKAKRKKTKGEK